MLNDHSPPLRLLVLDQEDQPSVLEDAFRRRGWQAEFYPDGRQGQQAFLRRNYDVIIADSALPEIDAITLAIEAKKIWPWQGFILTGTSFDDAQHSLAVQAGIVRMLTKPLDPEALADAVAAEAAHQEAMAKSSGQEKATADASTRQLELMRSITRDAMRALEDMRKLAIRDELTGLFNRRHLEDVAATAWQLAKRYNHPMAVMMLDIDQFKETNDRYGHHAGDELLKEFVGALRSHMRATDIVARYGGDEFVVVLPHADAHEAVGLAQRIRATVRDTHFLPGLGGVRMTASIGIALYDPDHPGGELNDLLRHADQAMYRAKGSGRDSVLVWSEQASAAPAVASMEAASPGAKARILVLDDEPAIQQVIRMLLRRAQYGVETVSTIAECRDRLRTRDERFDILLCDLSLPDGNGLDMIKWAREIDAELISLIITGNATTENAVGALREGAYDFISKPVAPKAMVAAVERALNYRSLLVENNRYREHLEEMVRVKSAQLSQALENTTKAYQFSLETMVAMLDSREYETGQHSLRVRELTMALARFMGYEGQTLEEIGRGALLHDIGKIGIPDQVLLKPGKLTEEEWAVMRRHPGIGYSFLKNSEFLQTAANIVLSHHECWDGSGYPNGIAGENISIGARIFSVIDTYDAMRSPRVYKKSFSREQAVEEIRRQAGTQFDPDVVKAFEQFVPELEKIGRWPV